MLTSFLITTATILPLLATMGNSFPGAHAAPAPQAWSPPTSGEYPDPEPCHGNCSWVHDPSIIYEDGVYWRFTTSGNIAITTAHDLKGPWTYRGALLTNGTRIRLRKDQDIWAPSVTKIYDTYYCHYAVSFMGAQHSEIGVATSKSLKPGSWVDHGAIGLSQNPKWNLIDPYMFQNDDSAIYFTFGSYWSGIHQFQFRDIDQLISLGAGSDVEIRNVIQNSTENYAVQEGAVMYKHDKTYYIFFSVGQCCRYEHELMPRGDEYHVVVCRADAIAGPYYDKDGKNCLTESGGTTILASHGDVYAPGGQGVMQDPKTDRTVMYYHYVNPNVGYEAEQFLFGFNYLEWKDGWPVLVAGGH